MKIPFSKYHGAGNDFVLIDNRKLNWKPNPRVVGRICHRRFGIGADGLMLLNSDNDTDFRMVYYNSDGHEASMCGNGGRCITAFALHQGVFSESTSFQATDGKHEARIMPGGDETLRIRLKLIDVEDIVCFQDGYSLDTGSPHFVTFLAAETPLDVYAKGSLIRHESRFAPAGTNVNFVVEETDGLYVRTFERGVEDETLSCGTGVTASALSAAFRNPGIQSPINIRTKGGDLRVFFTRNENSFTDVWLEGPATHVFDGTFNTQNV